MLATLLLVLRMLLATAVDAPAGASDHDRYCPRDSTYHDRQQPPFDE